MISYYQWKSINEGANAVEDVNLVIDDNDTDEVVIKKVTTKTNLWINKLIQEINKRPTLWKNPLMRAAVLSPIMDSLGVTVENLATNFPKIKKTLMQLQLPDSKGNQYVGYKHSPGQDFPTTKDKQNPDKTF